jgi:hypothetical protein
MLNHRLFLRSILSVTPTIPPFLLSPSFFHCLRHFSSPSSSLLASPLPLFISPFFFFLPLFSLPSPPFSLSFYFLPPVFSPFLSLSSLPLTFLLLFSLSPSMRPFCAFLPYSFHLFFTSPLFLILPSFPSFPLIFFLLPSSISASFPPTSFYPPFI